MVKIYPFNGVVYNKKRIKNLSKVVSPPYDVISPEMQDFLYESSDFNVVRLILGKEYPGDNEYNNKYVRAAASFEGWMRHGVLSKDEKPAIYIYEQKFKHNRKSYSRKGIIAILRLEDMGKGKVFPHEHTLSKPKLDRIELMRAASANFDCVFSLFSDDRSKLAKLFKTLTRKKPDFVCRDTDQSVNSLWKVTQKGVILKLQKEFKDKAVFIADGHHRYEAAIRFKNEWKTRNTRFTEEESYNHVMMYFTPIENQGLVILPIHRMVRQMPPTDTQGLLLELGAYFDIEEIKFKKRSEKKARKKLMKQLCKKSLQHSFGFYFKDSPLSYYLLSLKDEKIMEDLIEEDKPLVWKKLDVTILHALVFNNIFQVSGEDLCKYTRDENEALDSVKSGEFPLCVLLNPTRIEEIIAVASKYEKMPQKSTYFYPKLTTGIVMNKIVHGEKIV